MKTIWKNTLNEMLNEINSFSEKWNKAKEQYWEEYYYLRFNSYEDYLKAEYIRNPAYIIERQVTLFLWDKAYNNFLNQSVKETENKTYQYWYKHHDCDWYAELSKEIEKTIIKFLWLETDDQKLKEIFIFKKN